MENETNPQAEHMQNAASTPGYSVLGFAHSPAIYHCPKCNAQFRDHIDPAQDEHFHHRALANRFERIACRECGHDDMVFRFERRIRLLDELDCRDGPLTSVIWPQAYLRASVNLS